MYPSYRICSAWTWSANAASELTGHYQHWRTCKRCEDAPPMMSMHTCLKFRNGTNWTMSRRTGSPLGDLRIPSSPSSICMSLKSAFPTPTMMTDMGRCEAWTIASRVSAMSVMTPSVRISRMKYCCRRWEFMTGDNEGRGGGENDNSIS